MVFESNNMNQQQDNAGTPNTMASGQQQKQSSPQSVMKDSSSAPGPVFGSYKEHQEASTQQAVLPSNNSFLINSTSSNQVPDTNHDQFLHGYHQLQTQQETSNPFPFNNHQFNPQFDPQFNPQFNPQQQQQQQQYSAIGNILQPPNFHPQTNVSPLASPPPNPVVNTMLLQVAPPPPVHNTSLIQIQSIQSEEQITPTNQMIETPQPKAPKKPPRPVHYRHQTAPDTIDSIYRNNTNRERSYSNGSSSTQSSEFQAEFKGSILNDPTFSPPPKFPEQNLSVVKMRFFGQEQILSVKSTLPSFESVKHSGECMARFSMKSMIIKKWRQCFWIAYGDNQILFFRSKVDFEEWISNPYLKKEERDVLVKLNVDFVNDLYKPNVNGYNVTRIRTKGYSRNGSLQHFKLERWSEYGPMIAAAFASKNQNDVYCLRRIMCEMIERSPQRKKKSGYNSSATHGYDSDAQSVRSAFSRHSTKSATTVISVKSAPETYNKALSSSNDYGNPSQESSAFQDRVRRSRSVEPPKRKGRNRFNRKKNTFQQSDDWVMDPGRFSVRTTEVDYAL